MKEKICPFLDQKNNSNERFIASRLKTMRNVRWEDCNTRQNVDLHKYRKRLEMEHLRVNKIYFCYFLITLHEI
jgi:hypothetical protein